MRERPVLPAPAPLPAGITVDALRTPNLAAYRALFRKVGADWLWYSRLLMGDDELAAILNDARYEAFIVRRNDNDIGLLELDFTKRDECELAFIGLVSGATGKGIGRVLMRRALELAWSRPIRRLWLHTCNFDHPAALGFYIRSGFNPYAVRVAVQADPRLTGHLPLDAAPHVPVIRPKP
jgi:GNAT superfamily N-acetyltransferase